MIYLLVKRHTVQHLIGGGIFRPCVLLNYSGNGKSCLNFLALERVPVVVVVSFGQQPRDDEQPRVHQRFDEPEGPLPDHLVAVYHRAPAH